MREKFELILCRGVKCTKCKEDIYLLKPVTSVVEDLNNCEIAKHINLFYVCFRDGIIIQIGYGSLDEEAK